MEKAYQELCESLLFAGKQSTPCGCRKNCLPCWDKECKTLCHSFLRKPVGNDSKWSHFFPAFAAWPEEAGRMGKSRRDGKKHQGWEEAPGVGRSTRGGKKQEGWEEAGGMRRSRRDGKKQEGWEEAEGMGRSRRDGKKQEGWEEAGGMGRSRRDGKKHEGWEEAGGMGRSRRGGKKQEGWEEAVNSIDFLHSTHKVWRTINRLTGRSFLCSVSANSITSQPLKNEAHKACLHGAFLLESPQHLKEIASLTPKRQGSLLLPSTPRRQEYLQD